MATLTPYTDLNIVEMMKRRYGGKQLDVVKQLAQRNELLLNAPAVMANDVYTNVSSRWKKLPTPTPRSINAGGNKGRLEVEQIRESIMLLDLQVEIDEALVDHEPDKGKAIFTEMQAHLEGTSQKIAYYMIYGDPSSDSREPIGFATRRNALDATNCVSLGGTGSDLTSVYVIEWDPLACKLIYPRGSDKMGIDVRDHGKQRVTDSSSNPFYAYCHQVVVELGNSVVDERCVQRLCNIEAADTLSFVDSAKVRLLVRAISRLPKGGANAFIYGNRETVAQMNIYALEKANGFYTVNDITGRPLSVFQNIPIRMVEQITQTESTIT